MGPGLAAEGQFFVSLVLEGLRPAIRAADPKADVGQPIIAPASELFGELAGGPFGAPLVQHDFAGIVGGGAEEGGGLGSHIAGRLAFYLNQINGLEAELAARGRSAGHVVSNQLRFRTAPKAANSGD